MDYARARGNMVAGQLRPNQITDERILAAMAALPRESFVPRHLKGIAYVDDAVPIGHGRHLMEPMVLGRLLQAAELRATDVALLIGCGTGYTAAVLARVGSTVVAVESEPEFVRQANALLSELEITTVAVVQGPLEKGYPDQAPYNAIVFDGAIAGIPPAIADQLAEKGRLVAVVSRAGGRAGMGRATLVTRYGDALSRVELFDAGTPWLPALAPKPTFVL